MQRSQNRILREAFLNKDTDYRNRAVDPEKARLLQLLSRDLSRKDEQKTVVLTTGLGLSDQGVPLRLPALIVPAIKMLERFEDLEQLSLHYVIYQARDFICEKNNLNPRAAFNNAAICTQYLNAFIDEYFPQFSDRITIVPSDECELDNRHLEDLVDILRAAQNTPIADDIKKIAGYAEKRDTVEDGYLYYAAANIIFNGGYGPHYPNKNYIPENTEAVIPIGGKREIPFFNITSYIAEQTGAPYQIIPVVVKVGEVPAYYPYKQGDLLFGESVQTANDFEAPSVIEGDFSILDKTANIKPADLAKLARKLDLK